MTGELVVALHWGLPAGLVVEFGAPGQLGHQMKLPDDFPHCSLCLLPVILLLVISEKSVF